ncbi:MAG: ATP synthase subunit I [Gammaproteobacteria bacterium]|nr:ATP synthase subunit I [Gammaproteobacteria bacterium]
MAGVLRGRQVAWVVCAVQALIAGATAAVFYGSGDPRQALAALYGGAVAIVPAAYLGVRLLAPPPAATAQQVTARFYRGVTGKMAVTAAMFFVGAREFAPQFGALIAAFIACQAAYWLALAVWRVA